MTSTLDSRVAGDPTRRTPPATFRPDIEGLRAIAIVLVVLSHAGVGALAGGYVGVDVFFVLSGFLITALLLREAATTGRISIPRFYARRALRLLPAATVTLVGTLLAAHFWLSPLLAAQYARDATASAGYVVNLLLGHRGTDYLAADTGPSPFQHFWSLAVEEQFYLVWPLLIIVLGRRRRLRYALVAVAALSLCLSVLETHRSAPWAYFGTHTRVWELAVGALLAVHADRIAALPPRLGRILGLAGLAAIVLAAVVYDNQTAYPGLYGLLPVLGAAAVIAGGNRALAVRPLTAIGRLSYSWYLWHWPVLIIGPVALGLAGTLTERLVLAGGALGLAWVSLHAVENPIRHSRWLRSRPRYGLALGAAACAGVAVVALATYAMPAPIPHGSEASAPRLSADGQEPLAAAVAITHLPANLSPALPDAAADLPVTYHDGCHASSTAVTVTKPCAYGDLGSAQTVVLFGDSHAAQWFPALDRLARERHFRLVSLTKSSCTAADATIWIDSLRRPYTECDRWRRSALARIAALRPSLVVVSSTFTYRLTDPAGTWQTAWSRTFAELAPARIAVVSDTPTMNEHVPECLAQHAGDPAACNRPAGPSLGQEQRRVLLGFGTAGPVVIDPIRWLCSATCPTVLGNVLIYRDATHLTTVMSRTLAPLLAEALPR